MEIQELIKTNIISYEFDNETKEHVVSFDGGCISSPALMRIIKNDKLKITNVDDNHKYGLEFPINYANECNKIIKNKMIIKATALNEIGDLILTLDDSLQVEFLNDTTGYEPWRIFLKNGKEYIAAVGGKIYENINDKIKAV